MNSQITFSNDDVRILTNMALHPDFDACSKLDAFLNDADNYSTINYVDDFLNKFDSDIDIRNIYKNEKIFNKNDYYYDNNSMCYCDEMLIAA